MIVFILEKKIKGEGMRNPLFDSDIDGNTLNIVVDDGCRVEDSLLCIACKCYTKVEDYNEECFLCNECFMEMINEQKLSA